MWNGSRRRLHERLDESFATLVSTLDDLGAYDDTMIVYTSDHGGACCSHGLRAKLPCIYDEVLGVPLIVTQPGGVRAGKDTSALATHVDLATASSSPAEVTRRRCRVSTWRRCSQTRR